MDGASVEYEHVRAAQQAVRIVVVEQTCQRRVVVVADAVADRGERAFEDGANALPCRRVERRGHVEQERPGGDVDQPRIGEQHVPP